jgi:hypothetical protein
VINAVMAYAKGFCKEVNYMFDKRMIVVTALTGVAAFLCVAWDEPYRRQLSCRVLAFGNIPQ